MSLGKRLASSEEQIKNEKRIKRIRNERTQGPIIKNRIKGPTSNIKHNSSSIKASSTMHRASDVVLFLWDYGSCILQPHAIVAYLIASLHKKPGLFINRYLESTSIQSIQVPQFNITSMSNFSSIIPRAPPRCKAVRPPSPTQLHASCQSVPRAPLSCIMSIQKGKEVRMQYVDGPVGVSLFNHAGNVDFARSYRYTPSARLSVHQRRSRRRSTFSP